MSNAELPGEYRALANESALCLLQVCGHDRFGLHRSLSADIACRWRSHPGVISLQFCRSLLTGLDAVELRSVVDCCMRRAEQLSVRTVREFAFDCSMVESMSPLFGVVLRDQVRWLKNHGHDAYVHRVTRALKRDLVRWNLASQIIREHAPGLLPDDPDVERIAVPCSWLGACRTPEAPRSVPSASSADCDHWDSHPPQGAEQQRSSIFV